MQIHNAVITGSFSYNGADLSNVTSSNAYSASLSTRVSQIEQVYATTGSNSFRATQSITGSLTVTGQIVAQSLNVQQVTSSIVFSSGSNTFGCDLNSRQTFTGSVIMTGSLTVNTTGTELQVNNNGVILGNLLTDNHSITGSLRITGSQTIFGNAGIGTAPSVTSGITELAIGSSNTNPLINGIRDGVSAFALSSDSAGTLLNERRNLDLRFSSNNTERMRITSGGITCFSGNVCIPLLRAFGSTCLTINPSFGAAGNLRGGGAIQYTRNFTIFTDDGINGCGFDLQYWNGSSYYAALRINNVASGLGSLLFMQDGGNVGIGTSATCGLLSLRAEQTNTPTIVFQNTSNAANSAISNFVVNNQTYTVIGTNAYVNNTGNISRFNASYASSFIAFDEGDIVIASGTSGITPTARMRVLSGGDINTLGGNIRALGGGYVLRDSANTTTGGLFTKRMNWLGSGSDLSPAIAAETGYGIYTYTNGNASPSGPYVAAGGTTWTNGSSDVRKKKNFETTQGLAEILQVEPIKYHFNEDDDDSKKRLGFKAQNILPLIPEMVSETGELAEDGSPYLTVTPDYILPVLVKAIQEQQCTIESLKSCLGIS